VRILLYAGVDLALPGGLETHVKELAVGLAARGHEVDILGRPAVLPPFKMVDRVEPRRYDLVHQHGGIWPRSVPLPRPYVRTLHFCVAAKMAVYVRMGRLRTLAHPANYRSLWEERAAWRGAGRLIAVADRMRREFARWHGLDPSRARVIPNGAACAAPREGRENLRARHGIPAGATVVLTIGRDDFVKGFELFGQAWRRARGGERGAWWVTAGGASPRHSVGRVVTGPVSHQEVLDWIHAADLGALPSLYEGCGVALLEMLAGNLFTLAHDVGIAPEVIDEGRNGRMVERSASAWAAALARALEAPPPRGQGGLPPDFAWNEVVRRTEEVYREASGAGAR